jgi:lipopolysaccharide transport system ATP-binding protein
MSDIAIRVDNLSKQYRIGKRRPYKTVRESIENLFKKPLAGSDDGSGEQTFWALKDVSFEINQGEVVGIIGRNGAGKSTLLKVLSRITEPTGGQVETTGRVGSLLEVGTGFHPELTGRENVFLNGAILGMRKAEIAAKFDEIVAFAEIDRFLDTPVKHYSSGMYTRLAFAVAAHLEPEILIVDEVLAVGDQQFQRKCLGRMGEVAREGRTVLLVSHNLSAIRDICQTALWLEQGRTRAMGPAAEITTNYLAQPFQGTQTVIFKNENAIVESALCLDEEGREADVIDSRKNWSIRITYELLQELKAGASMRITTLDGLVIFEAHEFIRGAQTRSPGRYATTFDLSEVKLAPSVYYINVYIMAHHVGAYLTAEPCGRFTVIGTLKGFGGSVAPFDIAGFLAVQPAVETHALDPVGAGASAASGYRS